MKPKPAIIYSRITIASSDLVESATQWALRRGYHVQEIMIESNEKQPRLRQLLQQHPSTKILTPDIFHFATARIFYFLSMVTSITFIKENLTLTKQNSKTCFRLIQGIVDSERGARAMHVRQSLLLAKLLGKDVGRPALSDDVRERAAGLLREGMSLSKVVAKMDGRISRSALQRLAKSIKNWGSPSSF